MTIKTKIKKQSVKTNAFTMKRIRYARDEEQERQDKGKASEDCRPRGGGTGVGALT